jgi:O-antigen/teichoic acid export membrane protein
MQVKPPKIDMSVTAAAFAAEHGESRLLRHWHSVRSSDFVRKVAETYATRILISIAGLVTTVMVARLLGPEGRGIYAVAMTTGLLGVQFGNLGLHTANVYLVAQRPDSLRSLTRNSVAISFGFGGLIAVVMAVVLAAEPGLISLHGVMLTLALIWIPFGLAYLLLQHLMLGVHDVRGYNLLEIVNKLLPPILMAGLVMAGGVSIGSLFATSLFALLLCCAWSWLRLRRGFGHEGSMSRELFQSSFHYASKAYLAALFAFLVLRADLFMVQHMLGPEQAGYYSIASSMADYVSVFAVVISTILFPKLSAMNDTEAKLRMTWRVVWGTIGLLLPMLLVSSLLARPIVRLLFGVAFMPAASAFVLLMPGMLFLGINVVAVQFLSSIGYPRSVVINWAVCCVINIAVNVWVIPRYGIAGASVISSISYFLAFVLNADVIRRTRLRLRTESFSPAAL